VAGVGCASAGLDSALARIQGAIGPLFGLIVASAGYPPAFLVSGAMALIAIGVLYAVIRGRRSGVALADRR